MYCMKVMLNVFFVKDFVLIVILLFFLIIVMFLSFVLLRLVVRGLSVSEGNLDVEEVILILMIVVLLLGVVVCIYLKLFLFLNLFFMNNFSCFLVSVLLLFVVCRVMYI